MDVFVDSNKGRGLFPYKSEKQIALGDALALVSAIMYGVYTTLLKKKVGNEARLDLQLFFGFVGLFNMVVLFPGLLVLHFTAIEKLSLPPNKRVWVVFLVRNHVRVTDDND